MPVFTYTAKNSAAHSLTGEIVAESQDRAITKLEAHGLIPVHITEKKFGSRINPNVIADENAKASIQDILTFTWQLGGLIRAGVPILKGLSMLIAQTENRVLKGVVKCLEMNISKGESLSEAMSSFPRCFDNLYLSLVRAGEKGGSLDKVLYKLADFLQAQQEMRRKIQAALAYPILMMIAGIGTVVIILTCFLPKLMDLFTGMGQDLPLPTKILLGLSRFMTNNWYWFVILAILTIAVFGRVKPGSKKKFIFDLAKLHMPFLKKIVRNAEIARFSRTLGMLLENGISIYDSLELATNTLDNDVMKEYLREAGQSILSQGSTLSASLEKIESFPVFAINMIAVGESGGTLEQTLTEVANAYERQIEQEMKVAMSLLEPCLILLIGGLVGFIVFAMMLPVFNIGCMPM